MRFDSRWSVPEPELALVISDKGKLVGFTIGNDMSARDIEGENPLYLPQAKLYRQSCALGPCILIPEAPLDRAKTSITLTVKRKGKEAFRGSTDLGQMVRSFEDLIGWLYRENEFPDGTILADRNGHRSAGRFQPGKRRPRHDGGDRHRHPDEPRRQREVTRPSRIDGGLAQPPIPGISHESPPAAGIYVCWT